jgi:hypothetical protein
MLTSKVAIKWAKRRTLTYPTGTPILRRIVTIMRSMNFCSASDDAGILVLEMGPASHSIDYAAFIVGVAIEFASKAYQCNSF